MTTYLKLTFLQSYPIMLWAVALGTPFFLVFGWLSDRIGRKVIILAGCLIAAVTYIPIHHGMDDPADHTHGANRANRQGDPNLAGSVPLGRLQGLQLPVGCRPAA